MKDICVPLLNFEVRPDGPLRSYLRPNGAKHLPYHAVPVIFLLYSADDGKLQVPDASTSLAPTMQYRSLTHHFNHPIDVTVFVPRLDNIIYDMFHNNDRHQPGGLIQDQIKVIL